MLTHQPVPLSNPDLVAVTEFLSHRGKAILEKVIRGEIALAVNKASVIELKSPLDVLANGPQPSTARTVQIHAARLKIFLDVLEEMSRPETKFELARFEVE